MTKYPVKNGGSSSELEAEYLESYHWARWKYD